MGLRDCVNMLTRTIIALHCTLVMKTVPQNEPNTPKKRKYAIKWAKLKNSKIAYILFRFMPELTFSIVI